MLIERIPCASRDEWLALRQKDVTASVVGALFGVHEYQTPFGLYALKTGLSTEDPEETEAMKRGRLLEPVAVQLLREKRPNWKITHNTGPDTVYLRDPSANIGCTVDVFVECPDRGPGVVQIKSVQAISFRQKWLDADTREVTPPLWIVLQTLTEAHLAGAMWGAVAPLVVDHGIELPIIDIPLHEAMVKTIRSKVRAFWHAIENDHEPEVDFAKDGELIHRLYADADGATVDLSGNRIVELLARRERLKQAESAGSAAEKERKVIDTEIINMLGNATFGRLADGTEISAKTTRRNGYEVKPTSFRSVRVKPGFSDGSASAPVQF